MNSNNDKGKAIILQCISGALLLFFFLIIPWIINNLMMHPIFSTAEGLTSSAWLGFWGGYIGSVFAIITSLAAFLFTYTQNEKQHNTTREEMRETARLQVLPMIDVTLVSNDIDRSAPIKGFSLIGSNFYFYHTTYGSLSVELFPYPVEKPKQECNFIFTNIGLSTLINLRIQYEKIIVNIGNLQKEQSESYIFLFPSELSNKCNHFNFIFEDLQNHTYKQAFQFTFGSSSIDINLTSATYPQLM